MRRVEVLRHRIKELEAQRADYESVYNTLQTAPKHEAINHLHHLREYADVESYAEVIRKSTFSSNKCRPKRLEGCMNNNAPFETPPASTQTQETLDSEMHIFTGSSVTRDYAFPTRSNSMLNNLHLNEQPLLAISDKPNLSLQV